MFDLKVKGIKIFWLFILLFVEDNNSFLFIIVIINLAFKNYPKFSYISIFGGSFSALFFPVLHCTILHGKASGGLKDSLNGDLMSLISDYFPVNTWLNGAATNWIQWTGVWLGLQQTKIHWNKERSNKQNFTAPNYTSHTTLWHTAQILNCIETLVTIETGEYWIKEMSLFTGWSFWIIFFLQEWIFLFFIKKSFSRAKIKLNTGR